MPPAEPPPVTIDLPGEAWLPRATAERQVDDLAAELADPNKLLASIRSLVDLA